MKKRNAFKRVAIISWLAILCFLLPINVYAQEQALLATKSEPSANLISLNLKDVNIEDALKIIAQASGLNIVLDKDVKASVSIILKDIPWQTALENILKTNGLTYRTQENTIRVMTLDTVKNEEATIPLTTNIIALNFAKAEEMQKSLDKVLSKRGSIEVNTRTNSLIITDIPEILAKIEEMARRLDTTTPQVMIEALILDLKLTDEDQLGITWEMVHKERPERSILQRLSLTAATSPASGVIKYGKSLIPAATFNLLIEMWKSQGRVEILANPRIATMDNLPAHIELLERIPYQSESQSTEGGTVVRTIQFKDAGIKLTVTPHVTNKDDNIMINISTEQSFRSGFVETQPIIDSRKAETTLMVKDGETIAIGGLKRKQDAITIEKIPVLGDIPVLGQLFRRKVSAITDTELLIFVTPYLREQNLSPDEEEKLEKYRDKLLSATEKEEKPQEKLSDLPEEEKSEKIDEELLGSTWKEEQIEKPKEQLLGVPVKEEKADKPKEQLSGATEKHKIVLRDVVIAEALVEALDKVSKKPSVKETKR